MKILLTILIIGFSTALYSQSATSSAEANPNFRVGRPRPAPPSCCRPFRTINGTTVYLPQPNLRPSSVGDKSKEPFTASEVEEYRISLEAYRENIESLRKEGKLTSEEYVKALIAYKNRIKEYTAQYRKAVL